MLTDARGVPLSLAVTGANRHDQKGLLPLLRGIAARRPRPRRGRPQTLCLDKGYDAHACRRALARFGYRDAIRCRGEERRARRSRDPRKKPRRWVVERSHSWFTNWRKILVRYERKVRNYLGLLHIAAAVMALRAAHVLG